MTLKRQLLLVSLLALMLPWAGGQFIRETESALRVSQQQMLAGTARAVADYLARYPEDFPLTSGDASRAGDQLYGHPLETTPAIDGYFDDWTIGEASLQTLDDGNIRYAVGLRGGNLYLFVAVDDPQVVYTSRPSLAPGPASGYADRVLLYSANPPYLEESLSFAAEAPGRVVPYLQTAFGFEAESAVQAVWQDVPGGYHLEARIARARLGTHLGLVVENTASATQAGRRSTSFSGDTPGLFVSRSAELTAIAEDLVQQNMRLIVTDAAGWRIATAGALKETAAASAGGVSRWLRYAYDALVESGTEAIFAEPDPSGREQQPYVSAALGGERDTAWFRSPDSSRAIVAVAEPVPGENGSIGSVVLQQGTDAILSLTNQGLTRLMNLTLIAMLVVAGSLLGYASWLSRRIQKLSIAAVDALDNDTLGNRLPSSNSVDEIGDLSRSFSNVLAQIGEYNQYLRTLASKLSHELRTPLAIVTSSLENLEQEPLSEASAGYTARAKDGAQRLRRILSAMSEANRVEELMRNVEPEHFDLAAALNSAASAYRDIYPAREFEVIINSDNCPVTGSPELVIQMLDKLVANAVSFSGDGEKLLLRLSKDGNFLRLDVVNPGPPLPNNMRSQLFDSMVSIRPGRDNEHLGLGLFIARVVAEGHRGRIAAENIAGGVCFSVWLPEVPTE
tara:strand:- start:561 stop:2594 length:2034 start_codon:yes stop_codon:yes gene_type:complete